MNYNVDEMQKIFKEHGLTQFNVASVTTKNNTEVFICLTLKLTLGKYLFHNMKERMIFKHNGKRFVVEKFFVNVDGEPKAVFAIKKGDKIVDVVSVYEIANMELFTNDYLKLSIDEIIEED